MMLRTMLITGLLISAVFAQGQNPDDATSAVPSKELESPVTKPQHEAETLSTELKSLDSLGVLPKEVATPYQGGTRRVHLESTVFRRESPFTYNSNGRRDPFRALIADEKKEGEIQTDLLIVEGAVLTGIVWAEGQYLAMIRDKDSRTFFLREGDAVYSGRVTSVAENHIVVDISSFGEYRQVTLKVNG